MFADLGRAKEGLQEYADFTEEPVYICRVVYGRNQDKVEYVYKRKCDVLDFSKVVAMAEPRKR